MPLTSDNGVFVIFTSTGGLTQGADAGAEVSYAAEAPGQHTGGL